MSELIQLNFVGRAPRSSKLGLLLLMMGMTGSVLVAYQYHQSTQRRDGLEYRLAALSRARIPSQSSEETLLDAKAAMSAQAAAEDLATPWTMLLAELEQASKDSQGQVALLGVEPDHGKHAVRVTAEARNLALALAYVEKLQASRSLEYPMLDRHELRVDDPQRPVRFELTGNWRDAT